jgi:hypothetical protein
VLSLHVLIHICAQAKCISSVPLLALNSLLHYRSLIYQVIIIVSQTFWLKRLRHLPIVREQGETMTKEQADKFWEPLFSITVYAEGCREKLEKVSPLPEYEDYSRRRPFDAI